MSDAERSGSGVEATSAKTARKLPASISGNPIPSNGTLAGRCIATGSLTKNLPRADYVPNLKCANCGFVQPSYKIISTKASLPHFRRPWVERDRLHVELVSKDQNLGFQRSPRPNQSDQRHTRSTCKHRSSGASIGRFAVAVSRFRFAVGTGGSLDHLVGEHEPGLYGDRGQSDFTSAFGLFILSQSGDRPLR